MSRIPNKTLVDFLRSRNTEEGSIGKLKAVYRPCICPFDDLLGYVDSRNRVFDIGCGRGQFALLLAEFAKPAAIGGIEISSRLVETARHALAGYADRIQIDFHQYDGVHLPASVADYDTIFMIDVLHHIPREAQQSFLRNLHQGMSPGSRLIIKDIDGSHPLVVMNKLHDLLLAGEIGHELSVDQAARYAVDAGFAVQNTQRRRMLWYAHYTLVLQRCQT